MSVQRLLRRYGFLATMVVLVSLLATGGAIVYREATRDVIEEAREAIEAGRQGEARALLAGYLEAGGSDGRAGLAHLLMARAFYEERVDRDTLTGEALEEIEGHLRKVEEGDEEEHFQLSWKVVEGYARLGEHARKLAFLEWLGGLYGNRAAIDLEKAKTLLDLAPIHTETSSDPRFEDALRAYSTKADSPDRDWTTATLRAQAHERSARYLRVRAASRERVLTLEAYRKSMEWVLGQEEALVTLLESSLARLGPAAAESASAQRAHLDLASSLLRQSEILEDLHGKWISRYGAGGSSEEEAAAWKTRSVEFLERSRERLERIVRDGRAEAGDMRRARFLLADIYRQTGDFEEAIGVYEALARADAGDAAARDGFLRSLLGRARIAIELAIRAAAGEEASPASWDEVEAILARFEEEVTRDAALLAEGARVYDEFRDRRTAIEERELAAYLVRTEARPELGRARREQVAIRVGEFRERYSGRAGALASAAAVLAEENALRIECDWRAAEDFRSIGYASAEIQSLRDFIARSGNDPRPTAALYHLGRALERRGHFEEAEKAHQENVDLYPATPFAYRSRFELGRLAERRGDLEEALRRYASIRNDARIEFDPQSRIWRNTLFRLASIYEHLSAMGEVEGGRGRAEELYREALRRYPDDPRAGEARFRLGWIVGLDDRHDEAAVHLREAIARAEIDRGAESVEAAKAPVSFERREADELEPPPPPAAILRQARYAIADVIYQGALAAPEAERARRLDEAYEAYEMAVGREPGGIEEAWGNYQEAQVDRLRGRLDQAKNALEKATKLLDRVAESKDRERPEGLDPAYWSRVLEWELRLRRELGRRKES